MSCLIPYRAGLSLPSPIWGALVNSWAVAGQSTNNKHTHRCRCSSDFHSGNGTGGKVGFQVQPDRRTLKFIEPGTAFWDERVAPTTLGDSLHLLGYIYPRGTQFIKVSEQIEGAYCVTLSLCKLQVPLQSVWRWNIQAVCGQSGFLPSRAQALSERRADGQPG